MLLRKREKVDFYEIIRSKTYRQTIIRTYRLSKILNKKYTYVHSDVTTRHKEWISSVLEVRDTATITQADTPDRKTFGEYFD